MGRGYKTPQGGINPTEKADVWDAIDAGLERRFQKLPTSWTQRIDSRVALAGGGGGARNGKRMVKEHMLAVIRWISSANLKYSRVIIVKYLYIVCFIYCWLAKKFLWVFPITSYRLWGQPNINIVSHHLLTKNLSERVPLFCMGYHNYGKNQGLCLMSFHFKDSPYLMSQE